MNIKEEVKQKMLANLLQNRDIYFRSKYRNDRKFLRSLSMFSPMDIDCDSYRRKSQFSRLLSDDIDMRSALYEESFNSTLDREAITHAYESLHDDSDDADDEDDELTPTVERSMAKF